VIERICDAGALSALPRRGLWAQKIRSLQLGFGTKRDFCRFYKQGGGYIAALGGSYVVSSAEDTDYHELAEFFSAVGYTDIFCSERDFAELLRTGCLRREGSRLVNVMAYAGERGGNAPEDVPPSEIWNIIERRFNPAFEAWDLDMSHMVRHGITRCYTNGKAALVLQFDLNGEALISQVCVLPEHEGGGYASGLVRRVCGGIKSDIYIVCEDSLCGFYEKCGFVSKEKAGIFQAAVNTDM